MKKLNLTAAAAVAAVVMGTSFVAPGAAQAEVSTTVGVSSMYLWRGLNLTPDGGQVHGSLDYTNASGFYAGAWTTSEQGGHETDLYLGYGGTAGDFSYDISYWNYLYPEDGAPNTDLDKNNAAEVILSGSYGPISVGAYIQVDSDNNDDNYYTVSGSFEKFTILYGFWDYELASANEYSHITLSYQATDEISASISFASNDVGDKISGLGTGSAADGNAVETDPLFQIGYTKTFDLK